MRHAAINIIAQTLCECDGNDWLLIGPSVRDRSVRIAILIDHRIGDPGQQEAGSRLVRSVEAPETPDLSHRPSATEPN